MKYSFTTFTNETPMSLGNSVVGDVAIVAASWERRSKTSLLVLERVELKRLVVLRFANSGATGISGGIRNEYKSLCRRRKWEYREVLFDSVNNDYATLVDVTKEISAAVGVAKSIIFDISSTPRLFWCSLIALWDRTNFVRRMTFLYARPMYSFTETPDHRTVFDYTDGDWRLIEPAFLQPTLRGGLVKTNFISIGYEYDQIKRVLYQFEADSNFFVYSNPGFQDRYTRLAVDTVDKVKNVFEVPAANFIAYPVHDFIALQKDLSVRIALAGERLGASVLLVCSGSKIHSLAFLFCALESPSVGLRVRVPLRYKEVSTEWRDGMEAVVVENIFAPI